MALGTNFISFLPENVLIEIFSHLSKEEILNCTLVCQRFDDIISNSPKLLKNICIHMTKQKNYEWIENRRFSDFKLCMHKVERSKAIQRCQIVENVGIDLVTLQLSMGKNFKLSSLNKILCKCGNIKHLCLEDKGVKFDETFDEMPKLKLNYLESNKISPIFDIFKHCKAKTLFVWDYEEKKLDVEAEKSFKSFLTSQDDLKALKVLTLSDTRFPKDAANFLTEDIKFKLNHLCLGIGELCLDKFINKEGFCKLLDAHISTLELVELYSLKDKKVLEKLAQLKNLKKLILHLNQLNGPYKGTHENVQKLCFHFSAWNGIESYSSLYGKFPNLKTFYGKNFWGYPNETKWNRVEMALEFIVKLVLGNCKVKFDAIKPELEFIVKQCVLDIKCRKNLKKNVIEEISQKSIEVTPFESGKAKIFAIFSSHDVVVDIEGFLFNREFQILHPCLSFNRQPTEKIIF